MTAVYELKDVQFRFDGNLVLDIDYCSIERGRSVAIVGPNGSGKTTLLNMLAFLSKPARGYIKYLQVSVNDRNRGDFRRRVGYVQQNPYLFNMPVFENVELGLKLRGTAKKVRRRRALDILAQLGLENLAGRRAHELSGGEIQKVALARALVLEPEVLILDEPFTYLDKSSSFEFENFLTLARNGREQTVIFSLHDHIRAQVLADEVCSIIDGKLIRESSINLFHGRFSAETGCFDTGRMNIRLPGAGNSCRMIAVEPSQIVLSRAELDSSMRNSFPGRVTSMHSQGSNVHVTVDVGEKFHTVITGAAQEALKLGPGDAVWLSFKSNAVKVIR